MMRHMMTMTILVLLAAGAARAGESPRLRVHLPREVQVETSALALGTIAVVQASDEALEQRVAAIAMGRAPWSKEKLVVDRSTILGRLASHGVAADAVAVTGAERVVVTRPERIVPAKEVAAKARTFLESVRPGSPGCRWTLVREPEAQAVPTGPDLAMEPRLAPHPVAGEARIEVLFRSGTEEVGRVAVPFRLDWPHRVLVAARDLAPGEAVSVENTCLETRFAPRPEPAGAAPPYGQIVQRPIAAGTVVKDGLVRAAVPARLIRRGEQVLMRIVGDGFQLTALGEALEDGRLGETIRVRNVDSKRVVAARVAPDGTVEPLYER